MTGWWFALWTHPSVHARVLWCTTRRISKPMKVTVTTSRTLSLIQCRYQTRLVTQAVICYYLLWSLCKNPYNQCSSPGCVYWLACCWLHALWPWPAFVRGIQHTNFPSFSSYVSPLSYFLCEWVSEWVSEWERERERERERTRTKQNKPFVLTYSVFQSTNSHNYTVVVSTERYTAIMKLVSVWTTHVL